MHQTPKQRAEALASLLSVTTLDAIEDTFGGGIEPGELTDAQWKLLALDLEERFDAEQAASIAKQGAEIAALTAAQVDAATQEWLR